jgi:hypothetical protein
VRAREALEPVLLRAREARLLARPSRSPALLIEGTAYGADETPVEFARSYVRGDRTRYYIERIVVRASWQSEPERGPRATPETGPPVPDIHPSSARPRPVPAGAGID